jgi:hypothetical protein
MRLWWQCEQHIESGKCQAAELKLLLPQTPTINRRSRRASAVSWSASALCLEDVEMLLLLPPLPPPRVKQK